MNHDYNVYKVWVGDIGTCTVKNVLHYSITKVNNTVQNIKWRLYKRLHIHTSSKHTGTDLFT